MTASGRLERRSYSRTCPLDVPAPSVRPSDASKLRAVVRTSKPLLFRLFRAAALEGRPVPLGAGAVPSSESVGSTPARQAWPRRRVQPL